jgi:hypothetical protein
MLYGSAMLRGTRQILLLLIVFAFIGGTYPQIAHAPEYAAPMMMAGMPCDMMTSHAGVQHDEPMPPCKGMTPDCIKQMGCVTDAGFPARTMAFDLIAQFSAVDYWQAWSKPVDFVREPEPLPPRTI